MPVRRRIGFPVDAAQLGFAVGTGFAVIENLDYFRVLSDAGFVLPIHVSSHRDDWHRYLLIGANSLGNRLIRLMRFANARQE
jgi:hypothetical protein